MVDKDTELLSRVITNHLFLGQFEPFRATLLTLRSRNPNLARSILQTIVSKAGRFDNLLFSPSCPSPAHLTHLCTLELLHFNDPCSDVWSFGVDSLRLRAEFLICVQIISSRVGDSVKEIDNLGENVSDGDDRVLAGNGEVFRVLERVLEVGVSRLRPNVVDESDYVGIVEFEEEEFGCLKKLVLENAELFEALCENVEKQVGLVESEDSGLGRKVDGDFKVFRMIQRVVQVAHLDAMSECLNDGNEDGVIGHVRFLHLDYGVEESRYRTVLQDLVKRVLLKKDEYGDAWLAIRRKLLSIYVEALSSACTRLVQMIQGIPVLRRRSSEFLHCWDLRACLADLKKLSNPLESYDT